MRKALTFFFPMLCLFPLAASASTYSGIKQAPVSLCAEIAPSSPSFRQETDAQGNTVAYVGFSVDLLTRAFARMGREVRFIGDLPWSRCLQMVERGEIDFAFGAYYDEQRARRLAYSQPYKLLTPQIFYLVSRPIEIRNIADLRRYRGCGTFGSSYAHYGLDENAIDRGANSYETLVMKLKAGRCDYIPEELEVLQNRMGKEGSYIIDDPDLAHMPVAGAKIPGRHVVTAKQGPMEALLPAFNAAIAAMRKSGEIDQMWKKHDRRAQ